VKRAACGDPPAAGLEALGAALEEADKVLIRQVPYAPLDPYHIVPTRRVIEQKHSN